MLHHLNLVLFLNLIFLFLDFLYCCFLLLFILSIILNLLIPLLDNIKRWVHAELDVESWIEIDFIESLLYEPLLSLANFVYEEIDLLIIFSLYLLFGWCGDDRHGVLLLTSKFIHLLEDLSRFNLI